MPAKKIITPGTRFGSLTVIGESAARQHNQVSWICRCDCGKECFVAGASLFSGNTSSCGCKKGLTRASQLLRHGHCRRGAGQSKTYVAWANMRKRTTDPSNDRYAAYGGRGISVCDRWQSFDLFVADMGEAPSSQHSIDRIDVNGDYEPSNCRWITLREQAQNRQDTRWVIWHGERLCFEEACRRAGVKSVVAYKRLRRGWTLDRALSP